MAEGMVHFITRSGLARHTDNLIAEIDRCFSEGSVAKILTPTQRYLNEIDEDKSRNVNAVRKEIWSAAEDFRKLMDAEDTVTSQCNFQNLLMCIPGFILSNTGALSGALVTEVALVFIHYVTVSVLMQSS